MQKNMTWKQFPAVDAMGRLVGRITMMILLM
jgi:hypothetical protein